MSALAVVVLLMVPVFAAWVADAQSSASWNDTLGVTIDIWALAHRAHVTSSGTTVVFSPLLLTALCVISARYGARAAFPEARLSGRDLNLIMGAFVGGYIIAAEVLGLISTIGSSSINPLSLIAGPAIVALAGVAWAAWREREYSPEIAALDDRVTAMLPLLLRRSFAAAIRALAVVGALCLIILVILLLWHWSNVWAVHSQLNPGIAGGIFLAGGQLLALPNFVMMIAGWCTGAPVLIGQVNVGHSGMTAGTLPMIPAFGAIPDGQVQAWTWVCLAIPVIVGGYLGWCAAGQLTRLSSLRAKVIVAASAAVVATVLVWLLLWFSTASVSTGLLDYVGPEWTAWPLIAVELLAPAVIVAGCRHWLANHRR